MPPRRGSNHRGPGSEPIRLEQGFRDYLMYGVSIRSQFATPYLRVSRRKSPRIVITRSAAPLVRTSHSDIQPANWFSQELLADGSTYLRWAGLFEFIISPDGRNIAARELEHHSPEVFSTYLLGQVLSFALVKQGFDSLHASAIVVDGFSVGFLGDCGQGKSTLLASFLQAGNRQLTDDLLLLRNKNDVIISYPGPPRIKLLPDSVPLMGRQLKSVPMNPFVPKVVLSIDAKRFQQTSVPLRALYLLAGPSRSNRIVISTIPPREALLILIKSCFNIAITDAQRLERQFYWATDIVSKVKVGQISYPHSLDALPRVRAAILADL